MCAIVGSFDKDKLKKLIELNSYRGNHSYSLSEYDIISGNLFTVAKDMGEFDFNLLDVLTPERYYIAHTQAPTTDSKSIDSIHPSYFDKMSLWHNGIIKEDCIKMMQDKLRKPKETWDTALLNEWVYFNHDLSEIDGTFSCLRHSGPSLYLLRNEISPMFIDDEFTISSTKFTGSKPTTPGEVLWMDFNTMELKNCKSFTTKENPYYFG